MSEPFGVGPQVPGGRLLTNLLHFARALRAAGLPVGTSKVLRAVEAVGLVGLDRRDDFYWALHCVFVNRAADRVIFDQAFHVFWRNPRLLERAMSLVLPNETASPPTGERLSRRVAHAMAQLMPTERDGGGDEFADDRSGESGWTAQEILRSKDFESMSATELLLARHAVSKMVVQMKPVRTRRFAPHRRGPAVSLRESLKRSLRGGANVMELGRMRRRTRRPPLVVICDISGSMSRYSRVALHFAHVLTGQFDEVHAFVFGTRLTHVSRHLRDKDIDLALARIGALAPDWDGGTRIGACLRDFNHTWSRRVLGRGAVVMLITDGLDRDAGEGLATEMERLHKSCARLICLNPLLRYDGYEPRAAGMRTILPHVDQFSSVHNLISIGQLVEALSVSATHKMEGTKRWLHKNS
jgi:uncharacterized protein